MRSAPPLQVGVARFGVWRAILVLLAGSACVAMLLWWQTQPLPVPPWASTAAAVIVALVVVIAVTMWRVQPLSLRWDRQRWWVARGEAAEQPGELGVAIDLGSWLLLRFVADGATVGPLWRRHGPTWIPVQRAGLEAPWHALRCALHAARPAMLPEGAVVPAPRRHA